jgi:hypothetical protein
MDMTFWVAVDNIEEPKMGDFHHADRYGREEHDPKETVCIGGADSSLAH